MKIPPGIKLFDRLATSGPILNAVLPPSVNFHLWEPCNMRCHFCFATFQDVRATVLPRGHLPRAQALEVTRLLAQRFDKLTFVGGEPTLCPWLLELMQETKAAGRTTMLVTNGSLLTPERLHVMRGALDWLTLSIDSAQEATHVSSGRAVKGRALPVEHYIALADAARACGMRLKVNTVVTTLNVEEDMRALMLRLRPERWKIFQVLPIAGQNDGVEPLLVSHQAFAAFVARHSGLESFGVQRVPEDNSAMTGSYAMIDPAGRFFDNVTGRFRYSAPILEVGIDHAWSQLPFDFDRFSARGGVYNWKKEGRTDEPQEAWGGDV